MPSKHELPVALQRFVVVVALGGTAVAGAFALAIPRLGARDAALALLLLLLASLGDRFRFHLTHRTNVDVSTVAYLAMAALLPPALPVVLALAAVASGELWRRGLRRVDVQEVTFNAGQIALAVAGASLAAEAVRSLAGFWPGEWGGAALLVEVLAASGALLVVNTALVSLAAAHHLGVRPGRLIAQALRDELAPHGVMTAIAGVAVVVARDDLVLLPLLALPTVLVHRAIRESVHLREDTDAALTALVDVVELRDPYTAGHSRRVALTARALALRLGLTAEEADAIASAGRVHDIGKLALDPAILTKAGPLDDAEWAEMRRHPILGADVIAHFGSYPDGNLLVRHHHEAWDGSGYPDGLAGEAIPLGARILAVADSFDAMTSARPYRQAMSPERALRVLRRGAGCQWDPNVVAALLADLGFADDRGSDPAEAVPAALVA